MDDCNMDSQRVEMKSLWISLISGLPSIHGSHEVTHDVRRTTIFTTMTKKKRMSATQKKDAEH